MVIISPEFSVISVTCRHNNIVQVVLKVELAGLELGRWLGERESVCVCVCVCVNVCVCVCVNWV